MRRLHLFELEDFAWLPTPIRDGATAYLRFAAEATGHARALAPTLAASLRRTGARRLVDLCSGGAGPVPALVDALASEGLEVEAVLTDRHPNAAALAAVARGSAGRIRFRSEPVDATRVPPSLDGQRTLFNALHHFRPDDARRILGDAARARQPIAAFELVGRSPLFLLGILFAPLAVVLAMPFVRPLRPSWLAFTYLLPAIPLVALWDGLVSCLRVYSEGELRELVAGLDGGYRWEVGRIRLPGPPVHATYLLGEPAASGREAGVSSRAAAPQSGAPA